MNLSDQLGTISTRESVERTTKLAEYAAILSRCENPEPNDAARFRKLAGLLDISADCQRADVLAAVESSRVTAGITAADEISAMQKLAADAWDVLAAAEIECRQQLDRLRAEQSARGVDARFAVELNQQAKDRLAELRAARPNAFPVSMIAEEK